MATTKRRWYQFSLKTMLLVLTLLCVGPGGFLAYERHRRENRWKVADEIEALGGDLGYIPPGVNPRKWDAFLFGDDIELNVVDFEGNDRIVDGDLAILERFPELKQLDLGNTRVTDAGLVYVSRLAQLDWLDLSDTQITDSGLVNLDGLEKLETLQLANTQITDEGLERLVTLKCFKSLEDVNLDKTKVTRATVERFEAEYPNNGIHKSDW